KGLVVTVPLQFNSWIVGVKLQSNRHSTGSLDRPISGVEPTNYAVRRYILPPDEGVQLAGLDRPKQCEDDRFKKRTLACRVFAKNDHTGSKLIIDRWRKFEFDQLQSAVVFYYNLGDAIVNRRHSTYIGDPGSPGRFR